MTICSLDIFFPNFEPVHFLCPVLTVTSSPAYRFSGGRFVYKFDANNFLDFFSLFFHDQLFCFLDLLFIIHPLMDICVFCNFRYYSHLQWIEVSFVTFDSHAQVPSKAVSVLLELFERRTHLQ